MEIIKSSEQRYRAKYELRRQKEFGGEELCRHLADGEYSFPFLIYRETVRGGTNLSMANAGRLCCSRLTCPRSHRSRGGR